MIRKCHVQRRVCRPGRGRTVRVARRVFKFEHWTGFVERGEAGDVAKVCVGIVNVELTSVYFVEPVAAVKVGVRRDAGPDPVSGQRCIGALNSPVVCEVDHNLVFVGVAKENVRDDVGRVPINDLVEEIRGIG